MRAAKPLPVGPGRTSSSIPNGSTARRWRDHRVLRLGRVLPGMHADVEQCAGVGRDGVDRPVDRRHVDADDGDRRPRPDARAQAAGADQRHAVQDRAERAEVRLGLPAALPLVALQAGHRHVAVLVVQRGERAQDGQQRVRRRAAVLPAVLARLQRAGLDGHVGRPPQRRGQRRHAGREAAHVGDDQRVGGEALRVGRRVARQRAAADLLVALDAQLDADRRAALPGPQRADVGDDVRLRVGGAAAEDRAVALGRRERRRVPQRLVARRARRRSGCTAARSARPAALGSIRSRPAPCPAGPAGPTSTPAAANSSLVSANASSSGASIRPGTDTDGIATSRARSASSSGISPATAPRVGADVSGPSCDMGAASPRPG